METTSEPTLARVTVTKMEVELRIAEQPWVMTKDIGKVKIVSKEVGLFYFESTETTVQQGYLIPAKGIV